MSRSGRRRTGRAGLTGLRGPGKLFRRQDQQVYVSCYSQVKFQEQVRQRPPHWADRPHRSRGKQFYRHDPQVNVSCYCRPHRSLWKLFHQQDPQVSVSCYSQVKFQEQVRQRPPHWADSRQKEPQKSEHSFCTPGRYCAQPGRSPVKSARGGVRGGGGWD
jgi:hypothetical protein